MREFWMVWRNNGASPTYQHGSKVSAIKEAERLAREFPNDTFVVLQAISRCKHNDVTWDHVNSDDEIPF